MEWNGRERGRRGKREKERESKRKRNGDVIIDGINDSKDNLNGENDILEQNL